MKMMTNTLQHHGVLGMKWGVRKERETSKSSRKEKETSSLSRKSGIAKINKDGSVELPKNFNLQRVVGKQTSFGRKAASDLGEDVTYVSFTKGDNLKYEYYYGKTQGLLPGSKASDVLTLTSNTKLKSPSPLQASEEFLKILSQDKDAIKLLKKESRNNILAPTEKGIDKALANPTSKAAHSTYSFAFDTSVYNPKLETVRLKFLDKIKNDGYNMLMDPSDSTFGEYDLPMILLNKSDVSITGRKVVTKMSKQLIKDALSDYEKINAGKTYMEKLGFGF